MSTVFDAISERKKLVNNQDKQLDKLYGTVQTIKQRATDINAEVDSQDPLIQNASDITEGATYGFMSKNKQLDKIIKTENKCCNNISYYIIITIEFFIILIIIASWF